MTADEIFDFLIFFERQTGEDCLEYLDYELNIQHLADWLLKRGSLSPEQYQLIKNDEIESLQLIFSDDATYGINIQKEIINWKILDEHEIYCYILSLYLEAHARKLYKVKSFIKSYLDEY